VDEVPAQDATRVARSWLDAGMAAKKRSLVDNINRRKKAGTSRPKSRTTVSADAYAAMQQGWPSSATSKKRSKTTGKKKGKKKAA